VLVLLDLGSAALSLELALEDLDPADRERVRVTEAPLVEGAILAAVQASIGATLDEVEAAAAGAATMPKLPRA
jgi:dihydroxyacetone kinase DhaKLM complex PTS-EIIA-like component DhaM